MCSVLFCFSIPWEEILSNTFHPIFFILFYSLRSASGIYTLCACEIHGSNPPGLFGLEELSVGRWSIWIIIWQKDILLSTDLWGKYFDFISCNLIAVFEMSGSERVWHAIIFRLGSYGIRVDRLRNQLESESAQSQGKAALCNFMHRTTQELLSSTKSVDSVKTAA